MRCDADYYARWFNSTDRGRDRSLHLMRERCNRFLFWLRLTGPQKKLKLTQEREKENESEIKNKNTLMKMKKEVYA